MIVGKPGAIKMWIESDPVENAKAQAQRVRFRQNSDWLEANLAMIYAQNRGKCICVAGQELFVADSGVEAIALAHTAHPDDDGYLMRRIPKDKLERVYAHLRFVESL